ncbi:MAG: carboxypeptidase-like regulatory domain-containing protein [Bacteroidota bacterium]|nr:carboxypeptidase-like regulatory domain-containing protein [Bacteroidota bacterium]
MKQYSAFTVGIAMMLMALPLPAQNHTVSGTVVSAPDSQPLAGAQVVETGTRNGTATDRDGSFSLEVDNPNGSLTVAFIGFASQTVEIEGRTEINVSLEIDSHRERMERVLKARSYSFTKGKDSTVVVINTEGDTTIVSVKEVQFPMIRINRPFRAVRGHAVVSEEDSTIVIYPDGRTRYSISRRGSDSVERDVVVNTEGDSVVVIIRGDRVMRARIPERVERGRQRVRGRTDGRYRRGHSRNYGRMERGRKRVRDRAGRHQWHGRSRDFDRRGRHHSDSEMSREHAEELREMMVEVRQLAREVRQADEETHVEKMDALKAKVEELFEHQQSLRAKRMEERQENKEELIKEHIDRLLRQRSSGRR